MPTKELTYKDVWDNLSKIDCSDKVEKKMNLSLPIMGVGMGCFTRTLSSIYLSVLSRRR